MKEVSRVLARGQPKSEYWLKGARHVLAIVGVCDSSVDVFGGTAFGTVSNAFVAGYANNAPAIRSGSWSNVAPHAHKTSGGSVNLFADQTKALNSFSGPIGFKIGTRNDLRGPNYVNFPNVLPTTNLFSIGSVGVPWTTPIVVVLTVPVLLGLLWLVQRTKQGKAMRATAQDQDAAAMMGIDVNRTISFTFFIAGALAGVAGMFYALYTTNIQFDQGFRLGLIAFTAAVLGGIGNLPGAVLGAIIIGLIQQFNEALTWMTPGSDWTQSIVFAILILILVFRPEGLLGERTPEGG